MFAANAFNIRAAAPSDAGTIRRLSDLDSQRPLTAPVLIGHIDGSAAAAISLVDGRVASDPFVHTAAIETHLRMRARAYRAAERTPSLVDRIRAGIRPRARVQDQAA